MSEKERAVIEDGEADLVLEDDACLRLAMSNLTKQTAGWVRHVGVVTAT